MVRPTNARMHLGQKTGQVEIPPPTLERMREALNAVIDQTEIRHIYLVGGSLTDGRKEGERFLQLARFVKQANTRGIPVALGSGAIPDDLIAQFHAEQLVQHVCFNLEMWSEPLFAKVCPGKNRYVGYAPLDRGARDRRAPLGPRQRLLGDGGRHRARTRARPGMGRGRAHRTPRRGRPLQPRHHPDLLARLAGGRPPAADYHARIRSYFETLSAGYHEIRKRHGLAVSDGFMCHRCAYMQLECDLDRTALVAA